MSSIKTLVDSVKDPADAERKAGAWAGKSIVPFIPSLPDDSFGAESFIEMTLKVNLGQQLSKGNSVKKKIRKFFHGSVEERLRWKRELDGVIRQKPVNDPRGEFDTAELLLGDDPLNTFQDLCRDVCETVPVDGEAPGETDGTFASVLNRFLTHYFPQAYKNPVGKQKKYMRSHLRKPREVRVKQIFTRISQMNALFPLFPGPENVMFLDSELVDVILGMIPAKWQTDLAKMNFEPSDSSLLEFQTVLEKIEMIEDVEGLSITKKKSQENGKKRKSDEDEKSGNPKKKSWGKGDKKCALCLILGGRADTHTTDKCFFKDKVKTLWNAKKPNKVYNRKSHEAELNALVTKKVKKLTKKAFEKAGLNYTVTSSSSDSD